MLYVRTVRIMVSYDRILAMVGRHYTLTGVPNAQLLLIHHAWHYQTLNI